MAMTKEVLLTNVRSDGRWVGDCVSPRVTVPVISRIPVLGAVFTNFYPFELIILVMVAILWYIMSRTRYGMHLRACGDTPPGGRYGRYQGKQGALHGCHVFGSAFRLWGDVLCLLNLQQLFGSCHDHPIHPHLAAAGILLQE